jgi:hypothetical protein
VKPAANAAPGSTPNRAVDHRVGAAPIVEHMLDEAVTIAAARAE